VLQEDSNLAQLCLRWAPRATRIAYLITADEARARRIGRRTVVRCAARFQDLRDPYVLETWFLKTVVDLSGRALILGSIGARLRRGHGEDRPPRMLDDRDLTLWREVRALSRRRLIAVVLKYYAGLSDEQIADATGCSVSGASAALDGAVSSLDAGAPGPGTADLPAELSRLLSTAAASVEVRRNEPPEILRWAGVGRRIGLVGLGFAVLVAGVGVTVGARVLSRALQAGPEEDRGEPAPRPPPAEQKPLRVDGAPAWCPDVDGVAHLESFVPDGPNHVALRFDISLARGRLSEALRDSFPSHGAPHPRRWPHTGGTTDLTVSYNFSGAKEPGLVSACGPEVAQRTWIVVIDDGTGLGPQQIVFYLVWPLENRTWKVWGSYDPSAAL
jgi:hypothetical protein